VAVFVSAAHHLSGEEGAGRLAGWLTLFAGSMLGLLVADNLVLLFAFWELTSITSYLLIGHHSDSARARAAALQALLITGTGGLAMFGGLVVLGHAAGTSSLSALLAAPPPASTSTTIALIAVLAGAFSKSAAYPFHSWLPAAMAAPTPVSAYLHSATMVKAGIVVVARFAPAFHDRSIWAPLVIGVGLVTMAAAGLRALRQFDLKLLLAYGTVSQLGFLFVLFGLGDQQATLAGCALFVAHALFKAALFMVVGVIDHEAGTRDLRRLGGFGPGWGPLQVLAVTNAASMAGAAVGFGFVAKELALDALLGLDRSLGWLVAGAVLGASVLTVAYSVRFVWGVLGRGRAVEPEPPGQPARAGRPPALALAGPAALTAATVLLGVWPGPLDGLLTRALEGLAPGTAVSAHLRWWHGFTWPFLASVLVVMAGVGLFAVRARLEGALRAGARLPSGEAQYRAVLHGLDVAADRVTAVVQSGSLPTYAAVILTTAAVLPAGALLAGGADIDLPSLVEPAHLPLAIAVVGAALASAIVRRRFAAVLFLGVAGYAMAGLFMVWGAPDLALTQVVFETLSTVLFMLALRHLPDRFTRRAPPGQRPARAAVATLMGVMVFLFVLAAAAHSPPPGVSARMVERAEPDGHGRNVVNVILVDFRALDTLGEITVLAVAAIGVVALARAGRGPQDGHTPPPAPTIPLSIVELPVRLIFHALLIGSVFALAAGHNQPGGGFVGGLLAGSAIALRFVSGGMAEVRRVTRVKPWTILGSGLLLSVGTALVPAALGRPILESLERSITAGPLGTVKISSTLAFDAGVYLVVAGLVFMVFEAFGDERWVDGERPAGLERAWGGARPAAEEVAPEASSPAGGPLPSAAHRPDGGALA
jgi:multicomponent Na+:H+ antiporter subunit A